MTIELFKIYVSFFVVGIILYSIGSFQKIKTGKGLYKSRIIKSKIFGLFTFLFAFSGLLINTYIYLFNYKPGLISLTIGIGLLVGLSLLTVIIAIQYLKVDLSRTVVIDFENFMIKTNRKNNKSDSYSKIKKIEIHESKWTGFGNPIDLLGYILIHDENKKKHILTNASINMEKFTDKCKGIRKVRNKKWIQIIDRRTMANT